MSFLPALATWQFAVAGAAFALAPIVLHLWHRQRYRVLEWAAMQFLQAALQRQRRVLQWRDLLLMLLRTAAILLFGLALARPHATGRGELGDAGQPVHLVLLLDNSLSMGYQSLEGSLLDRARRQAAAIVDRLPVGSRLSVIPLAGGDDPLAAEPFDSKPLALEAIQRVPLVDQGANFSRAAVTAKRVVELVPDLPPRYVVLTDQQRQSWRSSNEGESDTVLEDAQILAVSDDDWDNTWVAEVQVPDGVADTETPTVIQAIIRHRGARPRGPVRVGLWVRDEEVDSRAISLDSADVTREVTFQYTFRGARPEAARPDYVPIRVALSEDRLVEDDSRTLLVPVVSVLPVVFVDQYGSQEDPLRNQWGETRHLRQLLAPRIGGAETNRSLVQIRHRQLAELDQATLADARLVVVAGVADPGAQVRLLREYVEQGGQLVIAAGAQFNPVAWNQAAWQNGRGILPLPLLPELLGALPAAPGANPQPWSLSFESLGQHPYFQLPGNTEEDLRDLYAEPFFFQVAQVDSSPESLTEAASGSAGGAPEGSGWLTWTPPEPARGDASPGAVPPTTSRGPRILARFASEQGPPYLVERPIGRGQVLLATSGLQSGWNTLPRTNAMVLWDRILRSLLQATLPIRNHAVQDRIEVPILRDFRDSQVVLYRPGANPFGESLDTGFLRTRQTGVVIERPWRRGLYRLEGVNAGSDKSAEPTAPRAWSLELAVAGDPAESDLERLSRTAFEQLPAAKSMRWLDTGEDFSLAGSQLGGQNWWWWLVLVVLVLLVAELVAVAERAPSLRAARTGTTP